MAKHKKKNIIQEPVIEETTIIEEQIIEKKKEVLCPKCNTPMKQYGGGPNGYSDFKCPACGAGLSKVI